MKAIAASILLASGSLAHSAVRHIVFDGVRYETCFVGATLIDAAIPLAMLDSTTTSGRSALSGTTRT